MYACNLLARSSSNGHSFGSSSTAASCLPRQHSVRLRGCLVDWLAGVSFCFAQYRSSERSGNRNHTFPLCAFLSSSIQPRSPAYSVIGSFIHQKIGSQEQHQAQPQQLIIRRKLVNMIIWKVESFISISVQQWLWYLEHNSLWMTVDIEPEKGAEDGGGMIKVQLQARNDNLGGTQKCKHHLETLERMIRECETLFKMPRVKGSELSRDTSELEETVQSFRLYNPHPLMIVL